MGMKIRIMVVDLETTEVVKSWVCNCDSTYRALQMYEDEVGEFQTLEYEFIN